MFSSDARVEICILKFYPNHSTLAQTHLPPTPHNEATELTELTQQNSGGRLRP